MHYTLGLEYSSMDPNHILAEQLFLRNPNEQNRVTVNTYRKLARDAAMRQYGINSNAFRAWVEARGGIEAVNPILRARNANANNNNIRLTQPEQLIINPAEFERLTPQRAHEVILEVNATRHARRLRALRANPQADVTAEFYNPIPLPDNFVNQAEDQRFYLAAPVDEPVPVGILPGTPEYIIWEVKARRARERRATKHRANLLEMINDVRTPAAKRARAEAELARIPAPQQA